MKIDELTKHSSEWELNFLAATPDLSHVVFQTPLALTPEASDEEAIDEETIGGSVDSAQVQHNLYEWGAGQLQLVNILPDGDTAHGRLLQNVPPARLAGMANINGLGGWWWAA